MSVYANMTGVLVELGRREDTEKSKGRVSALGSRCARSADPVVAVLLERTGHCVYDHSVLCRCGLGGSVRDEASRLCALLDATSHGMFRVVALRRMGRPLKTCIAIALNTKVPLDHPAPIRVANRDWQVHGTGFKARLARLLPRKLQPTNPPPPVVYPPFTVNIQRIGEQYRASPPAPSFPPDGLRPPDPVYRQARSVVDLPSYGEANRDGPPRYDEGPQAERRAEREEGEVTVEHNFVS